ncbi:hypothetical protein [Luteimonas saliphila]|uniref:hypothetical protein n=1 Tax=Luteimonas saliphila TaxID=2804919 RepID=UPI00192E2BA6|nr:hypothetical protein [Luteimonas saliphila]
MAWPRALGLCAALALAACGVADPAGREGAARSGNVDGGGAAAQPKPALVDPRPLQGAGAVAFDPARPQLAWAAGATLRMLDLEQGVELRRIEVGSAVGDLAIAPDGALWVIADGLQLWRDGALACRAEGVEPDRLLAVDGAGVVVAGYTYSDGIGMLRRQAWLDARCQVVDERIDPLPDGITGSEADPGAPLGRATLRPVRLPATELESRLPGMQLPAGAGVTGAVAVSGDGRWWVLEGAQGRTLWRRDGQRPGVEPTEGGPPGG